MNEWCLNPRTLSFIESLPLAIAVFDRQLCFLAASSKWKQLYSIETVLPDKSYCEILPEMCEQWGPVLQRALEGETLSNKDRWECKPWYEDDQSVGGVVLVFNGDLNSLAPVTYNPYPINELHILEQLKSAQDLSHIGSWSLDVQNNQMICSEALLAILEVDRADPIQPFTLDDLFAVIDDKDKPSVIKLYQDSINKQIPFSATFQISLKENKTKHIYAQAKHQFDFLNTHLSTIGTWQDTSELMALQRTLVTELDQSRNTWEILDQKIAFIFLSIEMEIAFASQAFYQEFHCQPQDILRKNFTELGYQTEGANTPLLIDREFSKRKEFRVNSCNGGQFGNVSNCYELHFVPRFSQSKWLGFTVFYNNINAQLHFKSVSETDKLTNLANRHKIDQVLATEMATFKRYGTPFSILLLDIDHFKKVNDLYGHAMGDHLLKDLALLLKQHTRINDFVGRWGGEEFIIVCPHTPMDGALALAEKLRCLIAKHHFAEIGQQTASFGVMEASKELDLEEMFEITDHALYKAKHSGRNCVVQGEDD